MEKYSYLLNNVDKLSRFNLYGLTTIGKVVDVYDGDTFDLALLIPVEELCKERKISKKKTGICLISSSNEPLVMRVKCRLNGLDARELKDVKGQEAKNLLSSLLMDKIINCDLGGYDKYGRLLVDIYISSINLNSDQIYLSHYLLQFSDLFLSYDGGKKQEFLS